MNSDTNSGIPSATKMPRCKGATVGKQGSARNQSAAVRLLYSTVHSFRPAQIVCIYDEILHPTCPFVQLLFCRIVLIRTIDRVSL